MTVDWAHTATADAARRAKARAIAAWCWDRAITSVEIRWAPADVRARLARVVGVNPPSTAETWDMVTDLLARKAEWAADHPGHPRAVRAKRRPCCTCRPLPCATDDSGDPCTSCAVCMHGCPAATPETCCTTPRRNPPTETP